MSTSPSALDRHIQDRSLGWMAATQRDAAASRYGALRVVWRYGTCLGSGVSLGWMKDLMDHQDLVTVQRVEFGAFYRDEWDRVYRPLAVILRDHDLAREAVDEAMVRAFQKWSKVRTYDNPVGWVYRVALNYARNRLRRRWRELPWGSVEPSWEMQTPNPDLLAALLALPLRQREVVVLRFLFDWSVRDVAAALGIAEGTVKSRLHRAVAQLREVMA